MNKMFLFCTKLTEINLETFNTANVINFERMFSQCLLVKSLDLSSFNTGKATNIGSMFSGCNSLTSINFGKDFNTESVISMSSMFMNCVNLKSLDLSQFITTSVTDMSYMFVNCTTLVSLDLSKFSTSSMVTAVNIFNGCSSLVVLDISNFDFSKISTDEDQNDSEGIFEGVSKLRYLNLYNVELGSFDFSDTDLQPLNLIVCKKDDAEPFSNTESKIFQCCETVFDIDADKCADNYILVNYASDFSSKNVDFTSQNSENKISAISTGNSIDSLTPVENINSVTINPNSILKIEFI